MNKLPIFITRIDLLCYLRLQNWEGVLGSGPGGTGKHPDNALNTKLFWLQNIKKHLHIPTTTKVWIWFDVCSVPQSDQTAQRKAVLSLCYFCQLCSRFMPLVRDRERWEMMHRDAEAILDANANTPIYDDFGHAFVRELPKSKRSSTLPAGELDAYAGRGWFVVCLACSFESKHQSTPLFSFCDRCRVEVLAALCPKRTLRGRWRKGPINIRWVRAQACALL